MIRRCVGLVFLSCFVTGLLLSGNLPDRWRPWLYSRLVTAVATDSAQTNSVAEISLPWDLVARCNVDGGDIRLINDRGDEVPYELSADRGDSHSDSYATHLVENSFVNGQYTQAIADAGEKPPLYDRVAIDTDKPDFIVWAELALSDDAKTWRVVEARAPIARFRSRSVDGTQTIPFQGLNSRYVRIRILQSDAQFPVTGIRVLYQVSRAGKRSTIPATFTVTNAPEAGMSAWLTNLGSASLPVSRIDFSTDTADFYRAVRVWQSSDQKEWSYLSSGTIYRYPDAGKTRESLRLEVRETRGGPYWRVEIVNGDDQPLANVRIALQGSPRALVFKREPGSTYRLLYGNQNARAPQYDLKYYVDARSDKLVPTVLNLGPEQVTGNYADPRPFTERHPILLWFALGIAVLLLGYTALRTLRAPGSPN